VVQKKVPDQILFLFYKLKSDQLVHEELPALQVPPVRKVFKEYEVNRVSLVRLVLLARPGPEVCLAFLAKMCVLTSITLNDAQFYQFEFKNI
jgi:hypothetical protein